MRRTLLNLYRAMLRAHGPRGWWPVLKKNAQPADKPTYDPRRTRLTGRQRFEIAVGAILTQNTAWANVVLAIQNLHRAGALSPSGIRRLNMKKLAALVRPSGYFNQKANKLKRFVGIMDSMAKKSWYRASREELLEVNGVGPETADSILLYALEKPVFVVDAYTRRLFGRHGFLQGTEKYDDIRIWFESNLPGSVSLFNDYHAQIVEIGKRHCHRQKQDCENCPLYRREFFATKTAFTRVRTP